jgi:transposase
MTFSAALRWDRIEAPWLLDRPINADRFQAYVKNALGPTLRHGDLVIVDNLSCHKRRAIRSLLRQAGAKLLFLPKYSPDLNHRRRRSPGRVSGAAPARPFLVDGRAGDGVRGLGA